MDIASYFHRYDWSAEELEPGIWRAQFVTDAELEFDLYVMADEQWLHFAISPFLPRGAEAMPAPRLLQVLLRCNQQLSLVRFALDADGDVNLVADLPRARVAFAHFATVLDLLVSTAQSLGQPLVRMVHDPDYFPPELNLE